ncbi:alpha/beta hydrolase-fold protein [Flavobacterium sp. I3-2]|uniref:alpha/beta hydrolase-fold protein n=1 Tax=Flavobacterium sp. I3-2 TaxID=2748319 RepID=UPI0015B00211|nr:alpha/beta hydrolase-fold protein [Flavobacterium sp. I3-2]
MKNFIIVICCLFFFDTQSQNSYSLLVQKARDKAWNAKEKIDDEDALKMFEDAFLMFADSIKGSDVYEASVVASKLNKRDKAFVYLNSLLKIKKEEDGYPTWDYVLGSYSKEDYQNLLVDLRWKNIQAEALLYKKQFMDSLIKQENEFYNRISVDFSKIKNPKKLYKVLKEFHQYEPKLNQNYSIRFKINDTLSSSFFVHLPKNYNPKKKYSMLFFLHGAVRGGQFTDFQLESWNLKNWNRFYTKYADLNEVILVFPQANKAFNWMLSDQGFFMVPQILKNIKKNINIDDDRVFISGHSNGATGAFSYLMKQPTLFSGFYGFNTYPKVFTGGTFIENIKNRSFINFSTDEDYYYPPNANDDFTKLMQSIKVDYKEYRFNGFPHWLPEFNESEEAYQIMFEDMNNRKRNSFPNTIHWQFDDETYGHIDWLSDIKMDTLNNNLSKTINFKIEKWLAYDANDSLIFQDVEKQAFDFPRKSAKINATYKNNVFRLETTNVKSLVINISPEMVQLNKKIKVYVNDKLHFNKRVIYNKIFMLNEFEEKRDREQLWINSIQIEL